MSSSTATTVIDDDTEKHAETMRQARKGSTVFGMAADPENNAEDYPMKVRAELCPGFDNSAYFLGFRPGSIVNGSYVYKDLACLP